MVTFNHLLKKVMAVSLFSLTLVPQGAKAMNWWGPGAWKEEEVNELLKNQDYEGVFKLVRDHERTEPVVADWLTVTARQGFHVPCMHEEFKQFIAKHQNFAPDTQTQTDALTWVLVSLILTKADVDCCFKQSHALNYNPFDLLVQDYAYALSYCSWNDKKAAYVDVVKNAKQIIDQLLPRIWALQEPVWVCTVKNTAWFGVTINYGASRYDNEYRIKLLETYKQDELVAAVDNIRRASFAATLERLDTLESWDALFALRYDSFTSLQATPEQAEQGTDLTASMMATGAAVDAVTEQLTDLKLQEGQDAQDVNNAIESSSSSSSDSEQVDDDLTALFQDADVSEEAASNMDAEQGEQAEQDDQAPYEDLQKEDLSIDSSEFEPRVIPADLP